MMLLISLHSLSKKRTHTLRVKHAGSSWGFVVSPAKKNDGRTRELVAKTRYKAVTYRHLLSSQSHLAKTIVNMAIGTANPKYQVGL